MLQQRYSRAFLDPTRRPSENDIDVRVLGRTFGWIAKSPIQVQAISIFQEPNDGGAVVDELPPFSAVSAAISTDGWLWIARGGRRLGFAKAGSLQELR